MTGPEDDKSDGVADNFRDDSCAVDSEEPAASGPSQGARRPRKNGAAGVGGELRGPPRADRSMAELLGELELWHSPTREPYATIRRGNHFENWPIKSASFKMWLRWRSMSLGEWLSSAADLDKLIEGLAAKAIFDGPEFETWVRVGELNGTTYVDLGDYNWRCVEIPPADMSRDEHYFVRDGAPIKFVRQPTMRAMPEPTPGGTVELFRRHLNVETEGDLQLTVGWIVNCFRPKGPYPILVITGFQGSGKSTLLRQLGRLIDPTIGQERNLPKDERDLFVSATQSHLQTFDNLSSINPGMSDAICRIASGGAYASRLLHSNGEQHLLQACKPTLLNGISDLARRGDLAQRSILVTAARLSPDKRRPEAELWSDFDHDEPMMLGVIFTAVAWALANQAEAVASGIRMADAAKFMEGAAESLGYEKGSFAAIWRENRRRADEIVIESDPFSFALVEFLKEKDGDWRGSTTDLLMALDARPELDRIRRSKMWPQTPTAASAALNRTRDAIESAGFVFERGHEGPKRSRRFIQFSRLVEDPAA